MLAEACIRVGSALLGRRPPDGRAYWSQRYWDREEVTATAGLVEHFTQHNKVVEEMLRWLPAPMQVAEIACGTGKFTSMAAKTWPQAHITAIDISPQAIAITRNHPELASVDVTLRCADFWQATLPPSDVVFCFDAIHHLGDVQTVLTVLRSLVNEGGALVGNVWTLDHYHEFGRYRYGRLGHLRGSVVFLAAAALTWASRGRFASTRYRTQLVTGAQVERMLRALFPIADVRHLRFHTVFVAQRRTPSVERSSL